MKFILVVVKRMTKNLVPVADMYVQTGRLFLHLSGLVDFWE